jgi:uncharacterized protein YyaL (SSP411 family)
MRHHQSGNNLKISPKLGSFLPILLFILCWTHQGVTATLGVEDPIPLTETQPSQSLYDGWPTPSLQQHAYWLPWGELSFQRAALFGRPVLFVMTPAWNQSARKMIDSTLSVPAVQSQINADYISIIVDPDRRPDIKERYQTGSWPVISFLLPSALPMLSNLGEDVEAESQPITMGLLDKEEMLFLLVEGGKYWKLDTYTLNEAALVWAVEEGKRQYSMSEPDSTASDQMASWLVGNADRMAGGYGIAPKYIIPGLLEYAAVRAARQKPELLEHAVFTLEQFITGPLYDSREGGIHRMAATPGWGSLQYEKMLLSNVTLIHQLLAGLRVGDNPAFKTNLSQTADFMIDVLGRPGGGFYFAQVPDLSSADGGGYWTAAQQGSVEPPPVHPLVLSGPTALAGAAVLRAGHVLDDARLLEAGRLALELVLERAFVPGRGVLHVIEPNPTPRIFLTAQADVALALLDGYESLGDPRYLDTAVQIVDAALLNLKVPGESSCRDRLRQTRALGLLKNARRPLIPNVRLARAMLRLEAHGQGDGYRDHAHDILSTDASVLSSFGVHGIEAALAIEELIESPMVIRITGSPDKQVTRDLRRVALGSPWLWTVVTTGDTAPDVPVGATVLWRGEQDAYGNAQELSTALRDIAGMDR